MPPAEVRSGTVEDSISISGYDDILETVLGWTGSGMTM
jgi:hypothetical protein